MTAWLTSLRDRPIAESERARAMAAVTLLLVAATILLAISRADGGSRPNGQPRRPSPAHSGPDATQGASTSRAPSAPGLARTADLFLAGYLRYLYGHGPASQVEDATPGLLRSLRAHPPRVSPGMHARRPRILALHSAPASSGLLGISAVVNDGDLVDYAIDLLLTRRSGQLLVSGLEGGAR